MYVLVNADARLKQSVLPLLSISSIAQGEKNTKLVLYSHGRIQGVFQVETPQMNRFQLQKPKSAYKYAQNQWKTA